MFGFDPLTLSAAYILASMTAADCPAQGPVEAEVQFARKDSPVVTNLTSAQLTQQYGHNPDATLATDGKWMVGGVTVVSGSGLQQQFQVSFDARTEVRTGTACFAVHKVVDTITYSPSVFIASDFMGLGCRYSATLMHEKRHVDTDVRLITDAIPDMRNEIEKYAATIGPQGPYAVGDMEAQKQRVVRLIADGLAPQWQGLMSLRRVKQAEIDTVQNYLRDTSLCPGQFPKFDGSQ